jgi:hypothetical protein
MTHVGSIKLLKISKTEKEKRHTSTLDATANQNIPVDQSRSRGSPGKDGRTADGRTAPPQTLLRKIGLTPIPLEMITRRCTRVDKSTKYKKKRAKAQNTRKKDKSTKYKKRV